MATALDTYNADLAAIRAAITGGSFALARTSLALSFVSAAQLPDLSTGGRSVTRASAYAALTKISEMIDLAERAANGNGQIQVVPVAFALDRRPAQAGFVGPNYVWGRFGP